MRESQFPKGSTMQSHIMLTVVRIVTPSPIPRPLIVTAAPPTASPNTIARFPTTRTITVVGIPGDGASAAQAATRANKRLIAPAPRRAVRFAILGMNRHVIIAMPVSYQIGPVAGGGEAQGVNTSLTLLNDPPGVGPPLIT